MRLPLRVVFFDAGGTLIRPRLGIGEIYAQRAADFGVRADAAQIEQGFRTAFAQSPPLAFADTAPADLLSREQAWWRRVVRAAFEGHAFADFEGFFQELYVHFARAEVWEVFGDVVPVLESLRARGLRLGVISNFDRRLLPLLRELGLAPWFDSVTVSSAAGHAKPDARIFAAALRLHGVAPEEALHVGDSEGDDVEGARRAGMLPLRVRSNGAPLDTVLVAVERRFSLP